MYPLASLASPDNYKSFITLEKTSFDIKSVIHFCYCHFDKDHYHPDLFTLFDLPLPPSLKRTVPKRQAEFLAGRYSAYKALKQLGIHGRHIGIGKHRNPLWPKGVIASISHTHNIAVCAATTTEHHHVLGIDIERFLNEDTAHSIKAQVINDQETRLLNTSGYPFHHALTIVFSAKESLFKALYPYVKAYFGFEAAEIISMKKGCAEIILKLTKNLSPRLQSGSTYRCHLSEDNHSVTTLICCKLPCSNG